jgi:protein disulfide-isomerase
VRRLLVSAAALLVLASPALSSGSEAAGLRWREIAEGEAEAKKTGKPALYFFTAEWCGPCHTIEKEVFADPKVASAIEKRYVPIFCLDTFREQRSNPPGFDDVARRYGLRGFPTLVVARPGSKQGIRLSGWGGVEETREFLNVAAEQLKAKEGETAKARQQEEER